MFIFQHRPSSLGMATFFTLITPFDFNLVDSTISTLTMKKKRKSQTRMNVFLFIFSSGSRWMRHSVNFLPRWIHTIQSTLIKYINNNECSMSLFDGQPQPIIINRFPLALCRRLIMRLPGLLFWPVILFFSFNDSLFSHFFASVDGFFLSVACVCFALHNWFSSNKSLVKFKESSPANKL